MEFEELSKKYQQELKDKYEEEVIDAMNIILKDEFVPKEYKEIILKTNLPKLRYMYTFEKEPYGARMVFLLKRI